MKRILLFTLKSFNGNVQFLIQSTGESFTITNQKSQGCDALAFHVVPGGLEPSTHGL